MNPYAPPGVDGGAPRRLPRKGKKRGRGHGRKDIEAALAALREHLSNPAEVRADTRAVGHRLGTFTMAFLGLAAFCLVLTMILPGDEDMSVGPAVAGMLTVLFLVLGLGAVAVDMTVASRGEPSSPITMLKSYVRALRLGRSGYAWACLCPTAREQSVQAPDLSRVAGGLGVFRMQTSAGVQRYAASFARSSGGHARWMRVKELRIEQDDGEVARLSALLEFQSWPRWGTLALGAGGMIVARLGLAVLSVSPLLALFGAGAALVGILVLRKRQSVRVTRTLLRGQNGSWYLFDPDILEGAGEDE